MPRQPSAVRRRQARALLDAQFARLRQDPVLSAVRSVPPTGWIRAVREALGMSAADLGRRMGVSEIAVRSLEAGEARDTVQLRTLRRAADALGCDLVYVVVPREGLEDQVTRQGRAKAAAALDRVRHTMVLEDQAAGSVADDLLLEELTQALTSGPGLWRDD